MKSSNISFSTQSSGGKTMRLIFRALFFYMCTFLFSELGAYQVTTVAGVPWYWTQTANGVMMGTGSSSQTAVNIKSGSLEVPSTINGKTVVGLTDYAFYSRSGLSTIAIPSTVREIGYNAFAQCSSLSKVYIDDIKGWLKIKFANRFSNPVCYAGHLHKNDFYEKEFTAITVPGDIASVNDYAFDCCYGLRTLMVSEGVTKIGKQSFSYCKGLVSVSLPSSMISIDELAFIACRAMESITLGNGVKDIGYGAFCQCTKLSSLTIPKSVTNIADSAFSDCTALTNIFFEGDAPYVGTNVFRGVATRCQAEVRRNATGWVADEKGLWHGLKLVYREEGDTPFADLGDNPTKEQVAAAFADSVDKKLKECITNAIEYNAYCEWAGSVKGTNGTVTAGTRAVKESPNAWMSFALGSDKLLESAPTDEDLKVEKFEPTSAAGKFDFTVSVEGVVVGSDAQEKNLKQVFGLEGAASLTSDAFSSGNVDLTFDTPENGKVKFTAGPKDAGATTFFMKVKVK